MLFGEPVRGEQTWSQKLDTIMGAGSPVDLIYFCSKYTTPGLYKILTEAMKSVK